MSTPKLSIKFSNGNIQSPVANIDGFAGLIGTGFQAENLGKIFIIHNVQEAEAQGITAALEPAAYRHIKEFYTEISAAQKIYLLLVSPTVTMKEMLDVTNVNYANKLIKAGNGDIAYMGVFRKPLLGYNGGANFLDTDSSNAVAAAKTFVQGLNNQLIFTRVIIEGRIANENSTTIYSPKTASNGFAGVTVGGTLNDGSASVGLVLGRKVKYAANIKIGKVANGPLSAQNIFIGTKALGEDGLLIPEQAEVKATSTLTITNKGTDGDFIYIYVIEANTGTWIGIASYTKIIGDSTPMMVASSIKASINSGTGTHGYTATSINEVVTITAPTGSGDTLNGSTLYTYNTGNIAVAKTDFTGGITYRPQRYLSNSELHNYGYITYMTYPNKAGFYFGIDNMASDDDYKILANGAVIDAVAKIVADTYINELESEVATNEDGTIKETEAVYLEELLKQRIVTSMDGRISGVEVIIDKTVNIINTSKLKVKARVLPVGYLTYIDVELGFTAGNTAA